MAKSNKNETKITRVKANDPVKTSGSKATNKQPPANKISKYATKVSGKKPKKERKPAPKVVRVIFKPFIFVGKYLRDSWREIKLVRWPTRKETWKMTGSVITFTILFFTLIALLDGIFNWIFKTILK